MNATQQPKPEIKIPAWVPPIFLEACGEHRRFDVDTPFAENACLWATNGVILVRRELTGQEYDEVPGRWSCRKRLPDAMDIWDQFAHPENLPYLAPLPPDRYDPTECPKCGGVGAYTAFHDCEECDGEGMIESCFRVQIRERPTVVLLSRYVGMLLRHGITCVRAGDSAVPVYFASNGFEGLLMTCKEAKP